MCRLNSRQCVRVYVSVLIMIRCVASCTQLVGTTASVKGQMLFLSTDTTGLHSSALHVVSFGQVRLFKGSQLQFSNNTGRYYVVSILVMVSRSVLVYSAITLYSFGASIYAEAQSVPHVFQHLLYNPLCFLLYEDERLPPNDWADVCFSSTNEVTFINKLLLYTFTGANQLQ